MISGEFGLKRAYGASSETGRKKLANRHFLLEDEEDRREQGLQS